MIQSNYSYLMIIIFLFRVTWFHVFLTNTHNFRKNLFEPVDETLTDTIPTEQSGAQ